MKSKKSISLALTICILLTTFNFKIFAEENKPYFSVLEFTTTELTENSWITGSTFSPSKLEYSLPMKRYLSNKLILTNKTIFNSNYSAVAEYTDVNGIAQKISIKNGEQTTLPNQPFDESVMTITLSDNENPSNKTIYTFNISRPRDTTKLIKSSGIVLDIPNRNISPVKYQGISEGAMQKANADGSLSSGTGVTSTQSYYRTFIYDDVKNFRLKLFASTAYAHIRYSIDNGKTWKETHQGEGNTDVFDDNVTEVLVQIIDDETYQGNLNEKKDGFYATVPTEYKIWIDKAQLKPINMTDAKTQYGDWYPQFNEIESSYWVIVKNSDSAPLLTYSVDKGATVKIGKNIQTPNQEGLYSYTLTTTQKSITVTSQDGVYERTYKIGYKKKSALDVPDSVVDYLCMGSQYTNIANYGANPEAMLTGALKSLGNFGGYVTFYYENPIIDNPKNKFGIDFYVVGNSTETNIDSMAELGQVYVSENGDSWYALAGSEHYEDKAIWDYTITYKKGDDGKAYWSDNYGNMIDYTASAWPNSQYYYMNDASENDEYIFSGILFKSQLGNITGDTTSTYSFASKASFGYADYYASNVSSATVTDVNPYVENPSHANGFDLKWAVDETGLPIDVSNKEFHYIKVATASNIYADAFKEKSTEVTYVLRTTETQSMVGKTTLPKGITISNGTEIKDIIFNNVQNVYPVHLKSTESLSIKVNGTDADDNIYVNNQRIKSGETATNVSVTKNIIRIIVQNGEKEPIIYFIKINDAAEIEDIKYENNKCTVKIKSYIDSDAEEFVGFYNADGILNELKKASFKLEEGQTYTKVFDDIDKSDEIQDIRVFLWNNNMNPFIKSSSKVVE